MIKQTDRGWVDLSNLIYFNNSEMVDWSSSIGKTVDFQYDDVRSTLTITGRTDDVQYVYIDVPGYVQHHKIYVGQIKHGQLGCVVKRITPDFKYEIGDVVMNLLLTGRRKMPRYKYYTYTCTIDGYSGEIREDHLTSKHGCPVCAGRKSLMGYNDLWTTRPDIAMLLLNPSDGYRLMEHSGTKTYFKCPNCGEHIYTYVRDVSNRGLTCRRCGDGFSYANKFMYNVIHQITLLYPNNEDLKNFCAEKTFAWSRYVVNDNPKLCGKKVYDLYIPLDTKIIIENHGEQHYKESSFHRIKNAKTLSEEQENDKIKQSIALQNGILSDHYIVLDCRKSEMIYIKNSIMNSNLPSLLQFSESQIDWDMCDKYATSSRVYEACCYWNDGIKNYKDIASLMKMHYETIKRYIRKGQELNIIQ